MRREKKRRILNEHGYVLPHDEEKPRWPLHPVYKFAAEGSAVQYRHLMHAPFTIVLEMADEKMRQIKEYLAKHGK